MEMSVKMTLFDLLKAVADDEFKKTHSRGMSQKVFERSLKEIQSVNVKSKGFIEIGFDKVEKPFSDNLKLIEVEDKGFWICEKKEGSMLLCNYVSRHQATMAVRRRENAFVVGIRR